MPVRVGTGSSAVDLSALRVAGVAPSKIMLGTGTSAVEAWSARYSASGSGGAIPRLGSNTWVTVTTHTVSSPGGPTSGTWSVKWRAGYVSSNTDVRVLRNGVVIATNSREAEAGWQQVNIPEVSLSSGDSLEFQAQWRGISSASGRYVDAWSWSLS